MTFEVKTFWFGDINDCPYDLRSENQDKPGIAFITNTEKDIAFDEAYYNIEAFYPDRDFDGYQIIQKVKHKNGKGRRAVAWLLYESKPKELDPGLASALMDLMSNDSLKSGILNLAKLQPWIYKSLDQSMRTTKVVDKANKR